MEEGAGDLGWARGGGGQKFFMNGCEGIVENFARFFFRVTK